MKASFLPTATYGVRAAYGAGWPPPPALFEPESGMKMMEELLLLTELADEVGFDWISFSEHHYSPQILLTPNPALFATAALPRIKRAKIALFGPVLPLHNPICVAEEVAMLDMLSGGRLLLLFLRGIPNELGAFSVNLEESRAMTQEAALLIARALTDPQPFSWEGKHYNYRTVAVWPGPFQRPHPPLFSSGNSFESATFAASQKHGLAISFAPPSYIAPAITHYKAEAARYGWEPREDQIVFRGNLIVTETDEEAQQLRTQMEARSRFLRGRESTHAPTVPGSGERQAATSPSINLLATAQFCGSPQSVVKQLQEFHEMGVGVVDLIMPAGLIGQEQMRRSLELLGKEVLPHIHAFE